MAYVYRHIRLDKNVPFYIGIGKTKYRHTAKQNRNPIWDRIVAKTGYEVEILFEDVDWLFACQKEIEFIKLYGRINRNTGTLANMTDGGDGNLGLIHTAESLKKISEASTGRPGHWKGKKMSEEFKIKLSESKKGKPNYKARGKKLPDKTKEAVRKHSIGNKYHLGMKHTEESKKKMSDGMKGRIGNNRKEVFQYSLDGVFIRKHESMSRAQTEFGISDICSACSGERKSSGGYIWKDCYLGEKIPAVHYESKSWKSRLYNMFNIENNEKNN